MLTMRNFDRQNVLRLCLVGLLCICSATSALGSQIGLRLIPESMQGEPQSGVLAVNLNGQSISAGTNAFILGTQIWLPYTLLKSAKLDIELPLGTAQDAVFIDPATLTNISHSYDSAAQLLSLIVLPAAFSQQTIESLRDRPTPQSSLNTFFLNYNATSSYDGAQSQTNALLEPGITFENSVFNSSFLAEYLSGDANISRLETSWTLDFPENRNRLVIGDTFASQAQGSELGSVFRFGGLQWGTKFEIDPYLVNYPLPTLYGIASQNSTVDLYINESLRYRANTETGPFAIDNPPLTNGAGDVQIVVTDLTGRRQLITRPFYVSTRLLAEGLSDYQVNVGALRQSLQSQGDNYGDSFAAGRFRYGLNEKVTAQGVAEWSDDHRMGGVSAVTAIPRLGAVSGSYAISDSSIGNGAQFGLAFERHSSRFSIGVRGRHVDKNYSQLGFENSGSRIRRDWTASLSFAPWRHATVSMLYTKRDFHDDSGIEIASMSYSHRIFNRTTLNFSARRVLGTELNSDAGTLDPFRNSSFDLTLSHALSDGHVARANRNQKNDRSREPSSFNKTAVSLGKSAPSGLGFGYRMSAEHNSLGDSERYFGALDWHTRNANLGLDVSKSGSFESVSLNANGSVVVAKNNVFTERALRDGFALVDLNGYADIGVYRDNQLVTRTNKKGYAVVPELAPYIENRVRIEANALPIDAKLTVDNQLVVPRFGGAIGIDFGIQREFAALVVLHDANGNVLPLGTQVISAASDKQFLVAHRGQVYITQLDKARSFEARYENKSCTFNIGEIDFGENTVHRTGPIVCSLR